MKKPAKKKATRVPGMRFEQALKILRRGGAIRRRGWAFDTSRLIRAGGNVFVRWGGSQKAGYGEPPKHWQPYPQDMLATDWERYRG